MPAQQRATNAAKGLSADEQKAVTQAAAEARRTSAGKNTEQDVLDAIAAMDDTDRAIATGLHALVKRVAPELTSRTWYGFPAYAKNGKVAHPNRGCRSWGLKPPDSRRHLAM